VHGKRDGAPRPDPRHAVLRLDASLSHARDTPSVAQSRLRKKLGRMDITPAVATVARWAAGWVQPADGRDDDERGQGLVEYALILVLIAIVVIVILQVVGQQTNNVFSNVSNGLNA
jgi:pilus assembly protein Flp/PilA